MDSASGQQSLVQEWKAKDASAAAEIARKLSEVVEGAGHGYKAKGVSVTAETVAVELTTAALGEGGPGYSY